MPTSTKQVYMYSLDSKVITLCKVSKVFSLFHYFLILFIVYVCYLRLASLSHSLAMPFKIHGYLFAFKCQWRVLLLEIFVKQGKASQGTVQSISIICRLSKPLLHETDLYLLTGQ